MASGPRSELARKERLPVFPGSGAPKADGNCCALARFLQRPVYDVATLLQNESGEKCREPPLCSWLERRWLPGKPRGGPRLSPHVSPRGETIPTGPDLLVSLPFPLAGLTHGVYRSQDGHRAGSDGEGCANDSLGAAETCLRISSGDPTGTP